MKKFILPFGLLLLAMLTIAPGCKKDTDDREKFLATYNVVESCNSGNYNFEMAITTSETADNAVLISNFGDSGVSASATVSGNNITIPQQTVTVAGIAFSFSGSGTLNGSSLSITYNYNIGGQGGTCVMTCTKK